MFFLLLSSGSSTPQSSQPAAELGGDLLELPMASLEGKPGISGRLWGSYLPVAAPDEEQVATGKAPRGISSK